MLKLCLGGSFNPIHHGHLLCARAAAEAVGAGTVTLVPTGTAPHKLDAQPASAADRLEMCRRAIEGVAGFEIDDREIRRAGPSYTIQTARELKQAGAAEVAWLIGADLVPGLPTWHEAGQLIREVRFIVMARPGWRFDWPSLPAEYQKLRENIVGVPQIDISATEIRRRVLKGMGIDFFTPPAVCRVIAERKLYR
jgi:nicotinate-nucleotide adenylyltransferase